MAKSKNTVKQNFDFNDFIAAGYRVPQAATTAADEAVSDQPPSRGVLRGVADTGLEVVSGAAKGIKFMSDAFGADNAVSGALDDVSKYVKGLQSAQAQGEDQRMAQIMKEAEDKGIWEQVKAGLSAAGEAPVRQTIGALATGIPQIAATMIPGVREASWGARMATMSGLGAVQGAGMAKSSMHDAVYQRAIEEGSTPEDAAVMAQQAQAYSGDNVGQIALGAGLNAAATGTGFAPALLKTLGKRAVTETAQDLTMPTMGKALGLGVVKEVPLEAAQGGQEQLAGNVAQGNAGFDTPLGRGVAGAATMEGALSMGGGLVGGAMDYRGDAADYRAQEAAAQAKAETDAAKTQADAIRATKPQGDGPLSKAVGAGIEAEAQKVEAAPVLGARLSNTPMADMLGGAGMTGTDPLAGMLSADRQQQENTAVRMGQFVDRNQAMLTGGGLTGNADPVAGMIAGARESDATSETNIRNFAQSRSPMVASDAARILDEAKTRGLDFTAAPHPEGGFMVVPRQWVMPAVGQRAEAEIADTLNRMAQADAAPVERAPRARAEAVDLTMPTADPVRDYVDGMRKVNTPAAKFYVGEFDAGRITPADVQQRMTVERGKTPDERLADAAAQAPKNTAQPGDLLNPKGEPFKTLMSARLAAKKTPGDVIEVVGGYSVRPRTEVPNAQATHVPASQPQADTGAAPSVEPVPTPAQTEPVAAAVAGQPEQKKPLSAAEAVVKESLTADGIARTLTDSIGRNAIKNNDKYWDEQVTKGYAAPDRAETGKRQARETWVNSKVNERTQKLATAIADKDPGPLVEAWAKEGQGTSGSEGSMDGFKELTGINLKKLNSAARAKAIYDWAGWDDARVADDVAQRNQTTSQRKAEQEAKAQADADGRSDRVASTSPLATKDGNQIGTVKSWVDDLVGQGFTELRQIKKGAITKTFLANPATGAGYPMPTGILREYADVATRRAKAAPAKPDMGNPTSNQADAVNPATPPVAEIPAATASDTAPFEHNGLKIRTSRVKVGEEVQDRWVVQSPENAEREARGERQIGGDRIVDTREQAIQAAEQESKAYAERKAFKEQADAEEAAAKAKDEAKKEANRGKSVVERRRDAILDKPSTVGQGTKREVIETAVRNGRAIVEKMVDDTAAKKRDREAVDRVSRAGYILGMSNENIPVVKAGLEARARLKANKYEKPEYRMYSDGREDGPFREISKTEYDHAQAVKAKPVEAAKPAPAPATATAPKAEELPDGWTAGTNGFTGRPVYRFDQGVGQPFAVTTRTEMGYEVQIRHGDKLVGSANMPGAAKFEALSTASEMLAKVATHKDSGEKPEAATPAVVAESLKTAAKNEDVKPSDMKKWLLGELDKAMLAAPDRSYYDDTVKGFGAADAVKMWTGGGNYGKDTHTGFLSFDVPGDGKFKVRNGMRGLLEFRQNVERSKGFSNTGARPVAPERNNGVQGGSGGQMSAITNMIEEGDFEAARDYAEAVGIALADVKVPRGERKPQWDVFLKDGTLPTENAPPPKKEDSWRKQLEDAKQSGDKKALQALHDKVRVALNGPAQAAGAEAVAKLNGIKSEIEQLAKQATGTDKFGRDAPPVADAVAKNAVLPDGDIRGVLDAARAYAEEQFGEKTVTNLDDKSEILIAKSGIRHALSSGAGRLDALAATDLENLIVNAKFQRTEPDRRGRKEIKAVHRYAATLDVSGDIKQIGIVVREHSDGRRYYDHFELHQKDASPLGTSGETSTGISEVLLDQPSGGDVSSVSPTAQPAQAESPKLTQAANTAQPSDVDLNPPIQIKTGTKTLKISDPKSVLAKMDAKTDRLQKLLDCLR